MVMFTFWARNGFRKHEGKYLQSPRQQSGKVKWGSLWCHCLAAAPTWARSYSLLLAGIWDDDCHYGLHHYHWVFCSSIADGETWQWRQVGEVLVLYSTLIIAWHQVAFCVARILPLSKGLIWDLTDALFLRKGFIYSPYIQSEPE